MAEYNFTVRATDNLGAYSDRAFSIAVKNTNVERFVMVGTSGLAHSAVGGEPENWTVEAGLSGRGVEYGNGRWVVWDDNNNGITPTSTIRTSIDAITWESWTITFPSTARIDNIEASLAYIQRIKFRKGQWVAFVSAVRLVNTTQYWNICELVSDDLVTWTYTGRNIWPTNTAASLPSVGDFEYHAPSDTWVANSSYGGTAAIFYRTGNSDWTSAATNSITANNGGGGSVVNLSGQWCVTIGATGTNGCYVGMDGRNWSPKRVGSGTPMTLAYANGRLICISVGGASSNPVINGNSLDGGRSWSASASTPLLTGGLFSGRQMVAHYGNMTVVVSTNNSIYMYSTNNATTFSAQKTLLSTIGSTRGVAVRSV